MAATFNIRAVKVLDAVLHYIVHNQSRLLTYESNNSIAGLKHEVLQDYIEYLKASYLVVEIRKNAPMSSLTPVIAHRILILPPF